MAANVQDSILLLGDSITQGGWQPWGFAQRLAYVYARKLDIINRGLSGYNTEWAIPVFEQCLAQQRQQAHVPQIRILTIWFGANDACILPSPQHVPLDKFVSNLTHMIHIVNSPTSPYYSPQTRILLMTPPPINTFQRQDDLASRDLPRELDRKFDITAQYAQAVRDVGAKESVHVVDVFKVLWDTVGHEEKALNKYFTDGLHLNAEGYTVVYDELIKTIGEKLPELHYDKLQEVFVPWDQIDVINPRKSLTKRKIDP